MGFYGNYKRDNLSSNIFNSSKTNIDQNGKKQKEVYPTLASLCHAWASENVYRGRSGSSMFFEDGIIYSYGHHYKAAKIYTNDQGKKLVLLNKVDYSVSTKNHKSEIRDAVKHLDIISVVDVDIVGEDDHNENLEYFNELLTECLDSIFKMKGYIGLTSLNDVITKNNDYCQFFGLDALIKLDDLTLDLVNECIETREAKRTTRDAKRKVTESIKEAKLKAENQLILDKMQAEFPTYLAQWENEEIDSDELLTKIVHIVIVKGPFGHDKRVRLSIDLSSYESRLSDSFRRKNNDDIRAFKAGEISGYEIRDYLRLTDFTLDLSLEHDLIRVKGNKVETSRGADVPLDHALRLLRMILNNEAKNGERVGLFTMNEIKDNPAGDKTISIGCHNILLSEAKSVLMPYLK